MASGSAGQQVNWKLEDDDGRGHMQMNTSSRLMLMQKLGQAAGMTIPVPEVVPPPPMGVPPMGVPPMGVPPPPPSAPPLSGQPNTSFMIANMFKLEEETEPEWNKDIEEDVTEECSKFGAVTRCVVETKRTGGLVYVQFQAVDAAVRAATSLHGRYFAGNLITVTYLEPAQFNAMIA
jgi:RNA-binding protein 39